MRSMILLGLVWATPTLAEVRSSTENGFEVTGTAVANATPERAFEVLGDIGSWWNSAHTYSGDARNLLLSLEPGGCFCETVPKDRSRIEHGRIVYIQPGRALRLQAALGPLQAEGVSGALTWTLKPVSGGRTEISFGYVVGGYVRGGASKLAPIVDQVLNEQLVRLRDRLDASQPK